MSEPEAVQVFIGLGSNLNDPLQQLKNAIRRLADIPNCSGLKVSRFYCSRPLGPQNQPDYINAVARLKTTLEAEALLDQLQAIEQAQGRRRDGERWGARTLDLDLLLYGEQQIAIERLMVPHPRLAERAFVLYPLADIAELDLVIPSQGVLQQLLGAVDDKYLELVDETWQSPRI